MNPYYTPAEFLAWMPERYIAELSDDAAGLEAKTDIIQAALDDAAEEWESGASVRDDIPIPTLNATDDKPPKRLRLFIFNVALFNLYSRRGTMNDAVREQFDIQMTWLGEVVRRVKNIKVVNAADEEVTETTESPRWGGDGENKFNNFTF